MRDYTKIEAWQLADDLVVQIYELTRSFPREEIYGLTSQIRRAGASVPANIAEGSARQTNRDYLHFLYIARGSLTEAQYFVHLSKRLGYISSTQASPIEGQLKRTFACMHALVRTVESQTGRIGKTIAATTSFLVLGLSHFLGK
jgi:four helix bundle protein